MTASEIVLYEIMAFERRHGRKPSRIVLVEHEFKEMFFASILQTVYENEQLDFKQPGAFYGVPISHKSIWQYGGSTKWLLLGDEP